LKGKLCKVDLIIKETLIFVQTKSILVDAGTWMTEAGLWKMQDIET
jgi:hypothetical protein